MNKPTRVVLSVVVALLLLSGTIYGWRTYANNRKLADLKTQAKEMFNAPSPTGPREPGSDRDEGFRQIREQVESLPESYQQEFRQSMYNSFQSREERRLDEYLKLSPAEKKKYLDKEIAESEKRRKEWEARRKEWEANRAQTAQNGDSNRQREGNNNSGGERRGGWGGGRSMSARLDSTTPAMRAKRAEYRRDMEARRAQLGLPPSRFGGR